MNTTLAHIILVMAALILLGTILYVYLDPSTRKPKDKRFRVRYPLPWGSFHLDNIRRGISIIGAAGSGKTLSVVPPLLEHFSKHRFSGVIHDYKDFELTEMAWPLFKDSGIPFHVIAFHEIHSRVNPIAPCYLPYEESVNEISRVLMENLLEQNTSENSGNNRFFSEAVEGLLSGLIWKMKTSYPDLCTLPHIIALFQSMDTKMLAAFLKSDRTAMTLAGAFLHGIDSEKQTAGVKSTLANALKKISSQKLFYVLSADEVPLDINNPKNPSILSLVNHPQYDAAFSPVIAMVLHTVVKQMSIRNGNPSFLLMEEAPTLKLPNMPRIPATLRSYDIATVYVMQDKVQNDLLYGERASKAILGNLSYQFFGKVNDPDTAKYYERFFEIVKQPTRSVSKNSGLSLERRITQGEKEVAKRRADSFFRLQPGEFVVFADGSDRKVKFQRRNIQKLQPHEGLHLSKEDLAINYQRVYAETQRILSKQSL